MKNTIDEVLRTLQTELTIDPDDFDMYDVKSEADLTFGLKELKVSVHISHCGNQVNQDASIRPYSHLVNK
jgi:hypothetical protein